MYHPVPEQLCHYFGMRWHLEPYSKNKHFTIRNDVMLSRLKTRDLSYCINVCICCNKI